ncbi:hypothetical protein ZOSMA_1780G00020, partial [Zostera marina]
CKDQYSSAPHEKIQGLYEVTFRALLDQKWKKSKAFMKLLSEPC